MQIGPRIRVGGSLGKAGDKIKKGVQKAASNPWVQGGLGLLTGGATIPLLAGAVGGGLKSGAGVGDVVGGAAKGFAAGTAGKGVRSLGKGLLNRIGGGAADAATSAIPAPLDVLGEAPDFSSAIGAPPAPPAGGFMGGLKRVGGKALDFAKDNPNATGMALQGVGNLATAGAENRLTNAQAAVLEQKLGESDFDFKRRQRNTTQYDQLWSPLGTAIGQNLNAPSSNPYAPRLG